MAETEVTLIERTVEATNVWLKELTAELEVDDRRYAYRVLRGFLHTLRDRLTVDEAAQLAAQLPTLLRGIYYEGWDPSRTPLTYRDVDGFLDHVGREAMTGGETEASYAVAAAARVLARHVSAGEIKDVIAVLPEDLRRLIAPA